MVFTGFRCFFVFFAERFQKGFSGLMPVVFRIFYDQKRDRSCWPPWPSASGLGRSKAANSAMRKGTVPELARSWRCGS